MYFKRILSLLTSRFKSKSKGEIDLSEGFVLIMDSLDAVVPLGPVWQIVKFASPTLISFAMTHPYITFGALIVWKPVQTKYLLNTAWHITSTGAQLCLQK